MIGIDTQPLMFVIDWIEFSALIKHTYTLFQYNSCDRIISQNLVGTPAVADSNTLAQRGPDFFPIGGHFITLLKRYQFNFFGTQT